MFFRKFGRRHPGEDRTQSLPAGVSKNLLTAGVQNGPAAGYSGKGITMPDDTNENKVLLERAFGGDLVALAKLFEGHRARLEQMVWLRLDRRLQGRLDPSDVLQEAYLDVARRFAEYRADPAIPFFLWLRLLTGQRLVDLHRQHLGAKMRDAGLEVSLHSGQFPRASSASLAELLLGRLTTASRAAIRAETQLRVQEALNAMDPIDREVLVLRHFEMLSNEETAQVLGLKPSAAGNRHMRALRRLKEVLAQVPGPGDSSPGP
jgi:RNA polymerase sigma-70 factor, ECF subfamily